MGGDLTFTATRFEILECSLVAVPADSEALIRKLGGHDHADIADIRARMQARQNMHERSTMMANEYGNADVFERMMSRQFVHERSDLLDENATHADRARARMKARQKILDDYLKMLDEAETMDQQL
jgi:N-methylhydantoinase B/oxoprolinase/acetone carboxylase alpha subunit